MRMQGTRQEIHQPVGAIFLFLCMLQVAAMCSVLFCDIAWYYKFFLSLIVLVSFVVSLCRYIFGMSKHSVIKAVHCSDGAWRLEFRDGKSYKAELLGDGVRTRFLSVLNFRISGRRQRVSVIYFP